MVHEAGYNAWAAYDPGAAFTLGGLARQASASATLKSRAICHAAYTVLATLFQTQRSCFDSQLATATPSSGNSQADAAAKSLGVAAGNAMLSARAQDGAHRLGDLAAGVYSEYTGYAPVDSPDQLSFVNRWQPLREVNSNGVAAIQKFPTPHWYKVRPFALASAAQFRSALAPAGPIETELQEVVQLSAGLNATTKAQADFGAGGPGTVTPPGQWREIAETVSARDANTEDAHAKLFFCVSQALLDAGIAARESKRAYDSVRPWSWRGAARSSKAVAADARDRVAADPQGSQRLRSRRVSGASRTNARPVNPLRHGTSGHPPRGCRFRLAASFRRGRAMHQQVSGEKTEASAALEYRRAGFLLEPELFSQEEAAHAHRALAHAIGRPSPKTIREPSGALRSQFFEAGDCDVIDSFVRQRRLLSRAQALLGSQVYAYQVKINSKPAFSVETWPWHQDYVFWREKDGLPSERVLTAGIFLDDVTDSNGPIRFVPGSHRLGVLSTTHLGPPIDDYKSDLAQDLSYRLANDVVEPLVARLGVSSATGRRGSVVYFDGNVVHGSRGNPSPSIRAILFVTYCSVENVPQHGRQRRPNFLSNRDPSPLEPQDTNLLALRPGR